MADEIEDTFDKLKAGAKAVAEKVTHPGKDLGDEYDKERGKETSTDYRQAAESGSNDPMSPEKIAAHEPTAVKRDSAQLVQGSILGELLAFVECQILLEDHPTPLPLHRQMDFRH